VIVPAENLVGELHHGWSVAGGSLAHERGMLWISESTNLERMLQRVVSTATHSPFPGAGASTTIPCSVTPWPGLRAVPGSASPRDNRGFAKFAKGEASPEHSVLKLLGSELRRNLLSRRREALGALGTDPRPP